jgi:lipopolysaccharide export system protein LptA
MAQNASVRRIGLLVILSILSLLAFHAQANSEQPITVQANQLDAYDQQGESHYQGDVIARQGQLLLKGDTLVVYHPQRVIDRIVTDGQPAYFEMNDPEQGSIKGHADRIVYYVKQEVAHLIGDAFVDRGQIQSIQAGLIIVDLTTMTLQATGLSNADAAEAQPGRVEMIFTPGTQD